MKKLSLYADTVLRKNGVQLLLMNRQKGGFRSWSISIESEKWLMDNYNVRLGEWSRDKYGEYCPVICIPQEEKVSCGEESGFEWHNGGTLIPCMVNGKMVWRNSEEGPLVFRLLGG
jgi:hypothetical protein